MGEMDYIKEVMDFIRAYKLVLMGLKASILLFYVGASRNVTKNKVNVIEVGRYCEWLMV